MGTRNLTMVIEGEKPVIAQYGQWDGYPSGQGATALKFLKTRSLKKFKEKLKLVRFATDEDTAEVNNWLETIGVTDGWMDMDQSAKYHRKYPLLTRDNGAEILFLVQTLTEPAFLTDSADFAKDSLFCEWAYVIDLDKNTFEVYTGFNETPLDKDERFFTMDEDGEPPKYYPVRLVKSYSLDDLPGPKKFEKECNEVEEEVES